MGFSQVVVSKGYALVAVHGLLITVACLPAEHGLWVHRLQWLRHGGSGVAAPGL